MIGTISALGALFMKDDCKNAVINAHTLLSEAENNIIRSDTHKYIVIDGLKDYIVVDRDDVLLIYPKAKEQNIKEVVSQVKKQWGIH